MLCYVMQGLELRFFETTKQRKMDMRFGTRNVWSLNRTDTVTTVNMNLGEILRGTTDRGSGKEPVVGYCEHGNEPSGYIKCWEILERLSNWWFLKRD
jgi:hypothetical protein